MEEITGGLLPKDVLEKLILDTTLNKYDVILMARRWACELQSKEGGPRSIQETIARSLEDILTGKVSCEEIQELPPVRTIRRAKGPLNVATESLPKGSGDGESEKGKSSGSGESKA